MRSFSFYSRNSFALKLSNCNCGRKSKCKICVSVEVIYIIKLLFDLWIDKFKPHTTLYNYWCSVFFFVFFVLFCFFFFWGGGGMAILHSHSLLPELNIQDFDGKSAWKTYSAICFSHSDSYKKRPKPRTYFCSTIWIIVIKTCDKYLCQLLLLYSIFVLAVPK